MVAQEPLVQQVMQPIPARLVELALRVQPVKRALQGLVEQVLLDFVVRAEILVLRVVPVLLGQQAASALLEMWGSLEM
jgi:hypothetical protein